MSLSNEEKLKAMLKKLEWVYDYEYCRWYCPECFGEDHSREDVWAIFLGSHGHSPDCQLLALIQD